MDLAPAGADREDRELRRELQVPRRVGPRVDVGELPLEDERLRRALGEVGLQPERPALRERVAAAVLIDARQREGPAGREAFVGSSLRVDKAVNRQKPVTPSGWIML
jgi:hypothetical protein